MAAAPSELNSSSIDILRAEMDEMIAWSNKLHSELDLNYADHYARMDRLVSAQNKLLTKYDVLQSKFDHFIDEHWRPMQHFTCGVVSCLVVFAGDASFELPFDIGAGSQPGTPFAPPPSRCECPSPDAPLSSQYFSNTGVGIDSPESLPSLLSQSSHLSLPSPPSLSGSWDEIEPHFIYSQLDAGRRQLSQGEFLALFSASAGDSPEPGTTVAYGVPTNVPDVGEGVRTGGSPGGV